MNPKALFVILLIVLIIYLGMTQKQAVCNPPYILHGSECCIDSNLDGLCDETARSIRNNNQCNVDDTGSVPRAFQATT